MANNQLIDTSSLTALITEFRQLQAKDSITPEALGSILQRIADLLATAGTSETQQSINNWHSAMQDALPYIATIAQESFNRNNVTLKLDYISNTTGQPVSSDLIFILSANTERAGVMTAQQVSDLNALRNRYSDTVIPAVEFLNELKVSFDSMDLSVIDNLHIYDRYGGRLVKLVNNSGATDGWIMHFACQAYVTQVLFSHFRIDADGRLITGSHDEHGFHMYKRFINLDDLGEGWSPWKLVGGDSFADVKKRVDSILDLSDETTTLAAKAQIAVEVVGEQLRVYGHAKLAAAGYVPYLFRHTAKRNRDKIHLNDDKPTHAPTSKGWHLFGSRHSIKVDGTVAKFSTNPSKFFHKVAQGYTHLPSALVHAHENYLGNLIVPWGKAIINLYDYRANKLRMIRLRYAIGYAKPVEHGRGKVNVLNLVSNLAEFSVVFNPRNGEFYLSRIE